MENINKIKASELVVGDIIYLGKGLIGRITKIEITQNKPMYLNLYFSDDFMSEVFKDEKIEKLN